MVLLYPPHTEQNFCNVRKHTQNTQLSHGNKDHRFFIHVLVLIQPFSPVKLDICFHKKICTAEFFHKVSFWNSKHILYFFHGFM